MTDLRTAAQQALEALGLWATGRDMDAVALNDLIHRLESALAEPVQEPAAWTNMPDADDWVFISGSADPNQRLGGKWHPLYTAPPQRKPLTDEEIYAAIKGIDSLKAVEVARAIEKAHGIE